MHCNKYSNVPGIMDEIRAKTSNSTPFDHDQLQYIIYTRKNYDEWDFINSIVFSICSSNPNVMYWSTFCLIVTNIQSAHTVRWGIIIPVWASDTERVHNCIFWICVFCFYYSSMASKLFMDSDITLQLVLIICVLISTQLGAINNKNIGR